MGAVIAVLFFIARIIIKVHIEVIMFLIKHFDITNSLIAGSVFQILTRNIELNIWVRVGTIIGIITVSYLLQHFFLPARIAYGILSSAYLGLLAYGLFQDSSKISPFIPMGITVGLAGSLNVISWYRMKISREQEETV